MHHLSPDTRLVALDLETTGLSSARHQIVELAAFAWQGGRETGEFQVLVNPGCPIPYNAVRIHGITDSMVRDQPRISDVLPAFLDFCKDSVLVAHNAPFDLGFLRVNCAKLGLPFLDATVIDTCALARQRLPGLPSYSLEALKVALGLGRGQAHRALEDARDCLAIFAACMQDPPPVVRTALEVSLLPDEFSSVRDAITHGGTVCIEYQDTRGHVTTREVRPLLVTGHGSRAMLEAHCLLRGEKRRFHLTRILRAWLP